MRILKIIILLFVILFQFAGKADVVGTPMHHLLFKSTLIAKAKIVNHTLHYYEIEISDIYQDNQSGIKEGDTIRIKKEMNVITSVDKVHRKNIEHRLTGVAFLGRSEQGWGIRQFPFFYDERVKIRFDYEYCRINGNSNEVKTQIQEYFKEFKMVKGKLIGKKTAKEVLKSNLGQLALTQYARLFFGSIDLKRYQKINKKTNCGTELIVLKK